MKTTTGFSGATVRKGENGGYEVVVSFTTEEQAAKFQNIAYAINTFSSDGVADENPLITVKSVPSKSSVDFPGDEAEEDEFMKGIAKSSEEAGFVIRKEGHNEPTEKQVNLARLISKKLIIAMPVEFTKNAYFKFISQHKEEFDKQMEAERGAKNV